MIIIGIDCAIKSLAICIIHHHNQKFYYQLSLILDATGPQRIWDGGPRDPHWAMTEAGVDIFFKFV